MSFFNRSENIASFFVQVFNLQYIFWGRTVAHIWREMHLSVGLEQSQQLLLFHHHWHTWWHLMISYLNSDAVEKRLEYPGGWRGSERVACHSVFGKSKPLSAAWCLQSSWLQHVPKLGGQQDKLGRPQWRTGACSAASWGPASPAAIRHWLSAVPGAACPSHVRHPVGQIPWNKPTVRSSEGLSHGSWGVTIN